MSKYDPDFLDIAQDDEEQRRDQMQEKEVRCKYCNERGLYWQRSRGAYMRTIWALADEDGTLHKCIGNTKPANPNEFDPV